MVIPIVTSGQADAAGTGTWGNADFDGDGDDELVIATPSESLGVIQDTGAVTVLPGSPAGVTTVGAQVWTQGTPGLGGTGQTGDRLGESWTTGDFDEDGYDDLAIGIPGDNLRGANDAGRVQVLFGSDDGLTADGDQLLDESGTDPPETGDLFGTAVAAADFDNDGDDDLAVGAPGERIGGDDGAGAVFVFRGSARGFTTDPTRWSQDRNGIADAAEPGDAFGASLAAGRVGRSSRADLVIGVPREDLPGAADAGKPQVLFGGGAVFSTSNDQQFVLGDFDDSWSGLSDDGLSSDVSDRFGTAVALTEQAGSERPLVVASAPFDNDPNSFLGVAADVGSVALLIGDDGAGLESAGAMSPGVFGDDENYLPGQQFGRAVTGVGSGRWVVASPGDDAPGATDVGRLSLYSWEVTDEGESSGEDLEDQGMVGEDDETGDQFGAGLWSTDPNGDGDPELAIGWRESLENEGNTQGGMVAVVGQDENWQQFTQSTPGVPETMQDFDRFGTQAVP